MTDKRFKKLEQVLPEIPGPEIYGPQQAPLTIVSFGSTKLTILEAMKWLKKEGVEINFVKVSYLNPFLSDKFTVAVKNAKKTLVIENNHQGQFQGLLREHTGFVPTDYLRKYDGRPFYPEEIVEKVKSVLSSRV